MKIGFVINDVTRGRGSERVAITVANELSRLHDVHFISLNRENEHAFFSIRDNIGILQAPGVRSVFNKITKKVSEIGFVRKNLSLHRYDVVIGVGSYPSMLLGAIRLLSGRRSKYIGWEHANVDAIQDMFWSRVRKTTFRQLDGLVCLNASDRNDFNGYTRSVKVIANPLSFQSEETASLDKKVILSVGAFEPEKGFDLLIQAFEMASPKIPGWKLVLIGEGSMKQQLEDRIRNIGLSERVMIKPPVRDIHQEYLQASIYVLPSRREGFGMVLAEAMECGLPCISFNCPTGPRHMIKQGENGILVPPEDTSNLADAICDLANDPVKMQRLAGSGKKSAEAYHPGRIIEQWQHYLNEILSR